ncbi:glycosyltransferase family 2 protein [Pelagibacterales bacterium SAG-MED09]|nr:glycosyltransferase family 2 protein [Pelagibacterales bacterium SAG-MED09]
MINSFYSFVTPVKNQENEIYDNIFKLIKKIKKNSFIKNWEIVIIDDGSDDKTFKKLIYLKKKEKRIKIFKNFRNKGKGYSIKRGINNINVKSSRVVLIDSDIPYYNELGLFLKKLQNNDLVIINRRDKRSKFIINNNNNIYSYLRFFIGNSINLLFRFLNLTDQKDTQAGLKGFNAKYKKLFKKVKTNGFLFDLELLILFSNKGLKPFSIPSKYSVSQNSSIKLKFGTFYKIFSDLVTIYINDCKKKYN